jgi:reversibly glycosylated polypeptide / UDP-arabinopyranose mutase
MSSLPSAVVVVPTSREKNILEFLEAWRVELASATILVIGDERSFDVTGDNVIHFSRQDIEEHLGEVAWIIPRRTGCVRSYGCYVGALRKPDMMVTLDDDCFPDPNQPGFLRRHWERLQVSCDPAWVSTVDSIVPRGMPYYATAREGQAVLNHGLWYEVPDYDAPTQLLSARLPMTLEWSNQTVPRSKYFPMCSMNLAWRTELTPAMYFLLMGPDYPYDRFGDIWGGVLVKRVIDHLGWAVNSGDPGIIHKRASNVWTNLRKEASGLEINDRFWQAVDSVRLTADTVRDAYIELAEKLPLEGEYWLRLRQAMHIWAELFPAE